MVRFQKKRRAGGAAVELAVILPLLTLVTLGTIEATKMIFLKQSLLVAAFEGARTALVRSTNEGNVVAACNIVLANRRVKNAVVTVSPADFETQPYGTFIRVTVEAPCSDNCMFAPLFYGNKQFSESVEMMKEID